MSSLPLPGAHFLGLLFPTQQRRWLGGWPKLQQPADRSLLHREMAERRTRSRSRNPDQQQEYEFQVGFGDECHEKDATEGGASWGTVGTRTT